MNNIFKKINLSGRELLTSSMLLLGFLTVNIEILPIGEYQPIILMGLAIASVFQDGKMSFRLVLIAQALLIMAVIGIFFNSQNDFVSTLKIFVIATYLLFGWRLVEYCNWWVLRAVIFLSLAVIFLGIFTPSIITAVLGIFFPRGIVYYMGFNSFFTPEPSYASLNLFGLYVMYLIRNAGRESSASVNQGIISLLVALILISTFSVTGVVFAAIIAMNALFIYANKSRRKKIISLGFMIFAIVAIVIASSLLENTRIGRVVYFIASAFDGNFLVNWLLLEPSSVVRFISNAAGWYDGLGRIFGTGNFSFSGGSSANYPAWLANAFDHTDIIGEGSSSQTPFFNIILHSGYLGLAFFGMIFILILRNLISLPRNIIFLVIQFLLICSFWQAALTYPFYWIVLSYLIRRKEDAKDQG